MKQLLTVRSGDFTLTLNDIGAVAQLPVAKCRKLFTEMLIAFDENTESVRQLKRWFAEREDEAREEVAREQHRLEDAAGNRKETELNKRLMYLKKLTTRRNLFESLCVKYMIDNGGK